MWPLILQKIKTMIENTTNQIVILEAAVLLSANWQTHCHEIWVSIIPPNEVKYLKYVLIKQFFHLSRISAHFIGIQLLGVKYLLWANGN